MDLILTDFFWNSDNIFGEGNSFESDFLKYIFLLLFQVHTICKNAELQQAQCLQKFYNTWEGALRYFWETCFQTSFQELYNNPQQSWQINSSKVRGGARGKPKAGNALRSDINALHHLHFGQQMLIILSRWSLSSPQHLEILFRNTESPFISTGSTFRST